MKSDLFPNEAPFYPFRGEIKAVQQLTKARHAVYLTYCAQNQRQYAMKTYTYVNGKPCETYECESRLRFLKHPNLVSIIDCQDRKKDQFDNYLSYILMEFAPYGNLGEFFAEGDAYKDKTLVRTIFHQVVEGLEFLHSKGVSHMDLKPNNILIAEKFGIKIADFEFAHFLKDPKSLGRGTNGYRAPELKESDCIKPQAADIYSLGILLFVLCTRIQPYIEDTEIQGNDLEAMFVNQYSNFWKTISQISEEPLEIERDIRDLIWSMTKMDPDDRATIQEIKKNKWYNGPVYSVEEYKKTMETLL
jgi:serine/threonine protein kinase